MTGMLLLNQEIVGVCIRSPVAGNGRELANHQAFDERLSGLIVIGIRAVVADLRIGKDHDLSRIRRIGENFLISSDGGIENHLTVSFRARTKTRPSKTVPSSRASIAGFNS